MHKFVKYIINVRKIYNSRHMDINLIDENDKFTIQVCMNTYTHTHAYKNKHIHTLKKCTKTISIHLFLIL